MHHHNYATVNCHYILVLSNGGKIPIHLGTLYQVTNLKSSTLLVHIRLVNWFSTDWLVVGFNPSEKYDLAVGVMTFPIPNWMESHNPAIFQTTNQIMFTLYKWTIFLCSNHQADDDSCSLCIPSGNLTVCYWKWPFIVDLPIKNGDFP